MRVRLEWPLLRVWCDGQGECAYIAFRPKGLELHVETPSDWHEHRRAWVVASLLLVTVAVSFRWRGKVPADDGQCSGPTYGFAFRDAMLWVYTGKSTGSRHAWKTFRLPWAYEHVRHSYLNPDGTVHHDAGQQDYDAPATTKATYPYTYVRHNGEVQHRHATVNGEEREWRLWYAPWLPWPRIVRRSINVVFDAEVGERSGSWKGGVMACGWHWRRGETQQQALERMEQERKL